MAAPGRRALRDSTVPLLVIERVSLARSLTEVPYLPFDAKPPVELDAKGHAFWASFGRDMHDYILGKANQDSQHIEELAAIAEQWKAFAAKHQARAMQMEGE